MLEEFYKLKGNSYPSISKEHFMRIAKSLFTHTRHVMRESNLEEVRIKGFGTYKVFPGTTKRMRIKYDQGFNKGIIPEKDYTTIINMIDKYENEL